MRKKERKIESDDSVYILGSVKGEKKGFQKKWRIACYFGLVAILSLIVVGIVEFSNQESEYYFEPENGLTELEDSTSSQRTVGNHKTKGYIEVQEETVNDVPLFVYIPHNAHPELMLKQPKPTDSTAVFVAYAADIRADNHQIVGDFVVSGQQIARGHRKKGYCAIIDHEIAIGYGDETPYLSEAITKKGFFFRQYALVNEGKVIENEPKNKSIRKALARRGNQIVMIESRSRESIHDFAQALVDIGVSNAIYLVSGNSFGWYYTESLKRITFGEEKTSVFTQGTNYIVWRSN